MHGSQYKSYNYKIKKRRNLRPNEKIMPDIFLKFGNGNIAENVSLKIVKFYCIFKNSRKDFPFEYKIAKDEIKKQKMDSKNKTMDHRRKKRIKRKKKKEKENKFKKKNKYQIKLTES